MTTPTVTKSKTLNYHVPTERGSFGVTRNEGASACTFLVGQTSAYPATQRQLSYAELQDLWLLLATVISEWPQPLVEWVDVSTGQRGVLKP